MMESDKAGGSAPSDGEEQGEQTAVAEQVQKEVKAELGSVKSFADELEQVKATVQKEVAAVQQTAAELSQELKNEIKESGVVDTIADLQQKEREAWNEYAKHRIGDPCWAASREKYLNASYKLGQAKLEAN